MFLEEKDRMLLEMKTACGLGFINRGGPANKSVLKIGSFSDT
jgi:hypothetical protein